MVRNYTIDYIDDLYYHIHCDDDSLKFPIPESDENDELIGKLTTALIECSKHGDRKIVDKPDCKLTKEALGLIVSFAVMIADEPKNYDVDESKFKIFIKETQKLIKRLTIITNRQAAYLRGER